MTGVTLGGATAWAVTAAVSLAYMFAGSKVWARHPRSRELSFGELVLWSWARRRIAERRLHRSAGLLDQELENLLNPKGRRDQIRILRELNAALEVRDPYTRGHARRVERHAHRTALAMRCSDDDIFDIRLAASLHDVGKIKVPDSILRKDGPLDASEWAVMKQHSSVGADLLMRLGNPAVVAAVRYHHERWDGRGYPHGLSGTDIPLSARIIAVADTFDAITSCRPYRGPSNRLRAIEVLKEEAGKQFDPAVVSAFLATAPHHVTVLAGAASVVAPFARKLAEQWGVVFNKVGAVSLAGTMTASAFTGVAAEKVDAARHAKKDRQKVSAPAERDTKGRPATPGAGAPTPRGNAFGHSKKAHAGGNGKSHAGGNGKDKGAGNDSEETASTRTSHAGGNDESHAGGNDESQGSAHSPNAGPKKLDDGTKVKPSPGKKDEKVPDAAAGAPAGPAAEPAPAKPSKPVKPKDSDSEAEEPAEAEASATDEPETAPAQPADDKAKGGGKDK